MGIAYLGEVLLHNLGAVVDREDDVSDTGSSKGLDLVKDHALVSELNERLWEGKGLMVCQRVVHCSRHSIVAPHIESRSRQCPGAGRTSGRRRVPKPPTRMRAMG